MAVTRAPASSVLAALGEILSTQLDGLRVYEFVADNLRPPGVVIGQPEINYDDVTTGFCRARFDVPLTVIVSRNSDREAQRSLLDYTDRIALALYDAEHADVFSIEPIDARPLPSGASVAGQDLPAYTLRVLVRA